MIDVSRLDHNLFAPSPPAATERRLEAPWKILIVDDDDSIHHMTKLVLDGKTWRNRPFKFLSAYSGAEAKQQVLQQEDIAVILLDVVMETEDAGLAFTHWLREERQIKLPRIILRTGQPGQAPEERVIVDYEIDDYKTKTELTSTRLLTSLIAALRAYASLAALERSRAGLNKIIVASSNLLRIEGFENFARAVLEQIAALLESSCVRILFARNVSGDLEPLASIGFDMTRGEVPQQILDVITRAFEGHGIVTENNDAAVFIESDHGGPYVLFVESTRPLDTLDIDLLHLFCHRIAAGFGTANLFVRVRRSHRASIELISRIVEYKDDDTGEHVFRVACLSRAIADHLRRQGHYAERIDDAFIEEIGYAAIIHDVGKVGVSDAILKKPGKLDAEEMALMRQHSTIGGSILSGTAARVAEAAYLGMGVDVAHHHHERWDGSGYPENLAGDAIPLAARIVAIADVFDALTHQRCYKAAWPVDTAIDHIRSLRGRDFDPRIVDAFLVVVELDEEGLRPYVVSF